MVNDDGSVDDSLVEDFAFCRWGTSIHEAEPEAPHMSHTAALKYCVDQARDSVALRLVREEIDRERKDKEQRPSAPPVEAKLGELPRPQKVSDQK